jgi:hypothetical protein
MVRPLIGSIEDREGRAMNGPRGMVCVGVLLLAVGGCALKLGNTAVEVGVKVNEQVINDALTVVAQRIEKEMRNQGLQVVVAPEGEAVRLTSTTKAGQKFVVVLSREKGLQGEQTRVHIDWEQATDKVLWLQLLMVAGQTAAGR